MIAQFMSFYKPGVTSSGRVLLGASPAPRQAGQQGRPAQPRAPRQAKVNHVTAESAAESPNVVIGTSMVNSYLATVLFDTGATHL